ncbi:hypothetical protein FRC08_008952 [Ceratobasidium sp. 394]|nr:hypothetical protein FRC08_008952 [Ceratobasidium sp. 394]
MFDLLGSIGGLLALLQGIHIFLFGRPLFWGMFGAKLLTPFGFVGQFATKTFRQRLQEHYHIRGSQSNTETSDEDTDLSNTIHMSRFLLDYVLDMGPASITRPSARQGDIESLHTSVELSEVQREREDRRDPGDTSQTPLLAVDQPNLSLDDTTPRTPDLRSS